MVRRDTLPSWAMRNLPPGWISGWVMPRSQLSLAAGTPSVSRHVRVTLSPTKQVCGGSDSREGSSEGGKKKKKEVKEGMVEFNAAGNHHLTN